MADKKNDPTISSDANLGTTNDPAPAVSDADDAWQKGVFKDNPDKPDPTSIAQVQIVPDEVVEKK